MGKAKALRTNIVVVASKFLYECILTIFGCPLTRVIDQGLHFINDIIKYMIEEFLLNMLVQLPIIHKEMDKHNLLTKSVVGF